MDLDELRKQINDIDERILALLNERAGIAKGIAEVKTKLGLPFYASGREAKVIGRLTRMNNGPFPDKSVQAIFREIMSATLALEKPIRIAYLGPEATFTHLAAIEKFGSSANFIPARSIKDVFSHVEHEWADYGVVPIENSSEGVVNYTLDMLIDSPLKICAELVLPISQFLLSKDTDLSKIDTVYSHPQVWGQCRIWMEENLPTAKHVEELSTSLAAQKASQNPGTAAIASFLAAKIYDLNILGSRIEDNVDNRTRFLVIGNNIGEPTGQDKTSIMFSIKDEVGALFNMLKPFGNHNLNLTKIESRPSRRQAWQYLFFVDFRGHISQMEAREALKELEGKCLLLKVLGAYPEDTSLG